MLLTTSKSLSNWLQNQPKPIYQKAWYADRRTLHDARIIRKFKDTGPEAGRWDLKSNCDVGFLVSIVSLTDVSLQTLGLVLLTHFIGKETENQ